jgi:biofilm PGA synthesis N-glycosyltransferase PgaC
MGGVQVMLKHMRVERIFVWKSRRMWPVLAEYMLSVAWSYAMLAVALLWLADLFVELPPDYQVPTLLSGWAGIMLGTTCLLQIGVSLALDSRYDATPLRHFFWMIWYPLAYWMLSMAATVVAVPRALFRALRSGRVGVRPDRGIRA